MRCDDAGVCQSRVRLYKTAEWIEILCPVETPGGPDNIVLDGHPHPSWPGGIRCGLCHITFATFFSSTVGLN